MAESGVALAFILEHEHYFSMRKEKEMPTFIKTAEFADETMTEIDLKRLADMNLSLFHYIKLEGDSDYPNEFSDVSSLSLFPNLESMYIDGAETISLQRIPSLSSLTKLSIDGTGVNAIDLINKCPNLKELSLYKTNVCKGGILPRLDIFRRIETLAIWNEEIENISAIGLCSSSLKSLNMSSNSKLADISPIHALFLLERLEMNFNNELVDITPLSKLNNLKYLNMRDNKKLSDISPLSGLRQLEYLDIRNTSIRNYNPILPLRLLKDLKIGEYSLKAKPFARRIIKKIKAELPYCELVVNYDQNEKNTLELIDEIAKAWS